jgi:hypothetical protein
MRLAVSLTAAALVVTASAGLAAAQPALAPLADPAVPAEWTPPPPGTKSELAATGLAFGATLGGYALAFAAANTQSSAMGEAALGLIVIGPSAGHLYAGERGHALGMSALRAGGLVTFAVGLMATVTYGAETDLSGASCPNGCGGPPPSNAHWAGPAAMLVGGTAFTAGTIYDLLDAHRAVERANAKLVRDVVVAPTIIHVQNGVAPGMALTGRW